MNLARIRPAGEASAISLRNYRPGDEGTIAELLNSVYPGGWGDADRWRQRHSLRPGFSPEDVWLAFSGDELVGCLHTAVASVSLGGGRSVPAAIDGDLAVHDEWRARGVAETLYAGSRDGLRRRGVVLRFGFSEASLRVHYYTRVLGYATGFDATRAWKKQLDPRALAASMVERLGGDASAADDGRGPILRLELTDLGPVNLRLGPDGVRLRGDGRGPTLTIRGRQSLLNEMRQGPAALLKALKEGRARAVGSPRAMVAVALWCVARKLRERRQRSR